MNYRGFTLIELLVVVIIMGTLTSIALPQYRKAMDRAKVAEAMQLLPAIFEARERWMIENNLHWDKGVAKKANGDTVTPTFGKLDIETKGSVDNNGVLQTRYFQYHLVAEIDHNPPSVRASPKWGESRGIPSATIAYRGDKFCCFDHAEGGTNCKILNVEESSECDEE